mgnify:CR=1 FL=1
MLGRLNTGRILDLACPVIGIDYVQTLITRRSRFYLRNTLSISKQTPAIVSNAKLITDIWLGSSAPEGGLCTRRQSWHIAAHAIRHSSEE